MATRGQAVPPFMRLAGHPLRWRLLVELAGSDRRVRELSTALDQPQNLISYHLRLLRSGGLVTARRSSYDGRDSYYHLDVARCADALTGTATTLHPALRPVAGPPTGPTGPHKITCRILFLCTGNSSRSPMAEALLRLRGGEGIEVASAGSHPKPDLHPNAVRVMREEYGLDLTGQRPQHVDALPDHRYDFVISLCDKVRERCPKHLRHGILVHWSLPDPAATDETDRASYPAFRRTAAELDTRIGFLLPVVEQSLSR